MRLGWILWLSVCFLGGLFFIFFIYYYYYSFEYKPILYVYKPFLLVRSSRGALRFLSELRDMRSIRLTQPAYLERVPRRLGGNFIYPFCLPSMR